MRWVASAPSRKSRASWRSSRPRRTSPASCFNSTAGSRDGASPRNTRMTRKKLNPFDTELMARLDALAEAGLSPKLRRGDSPQGLLLEIFSGPLLNFSSHHSLGLANHPALKEAAIKSVEKFGAGSGASRLICGSLAPHHELEEALAAWKGTEAALTFSTGYATALGTITALLGRDDIIVVDKLVHASIVDAARLSGAKLRVFQQNDLDVLERILKWADKTRNEKSRAFIVTDSVFSMDVVLAPLLDLVELKEQYGAWLM